MTSSSDAERLIYLSGYHLSYTSADKIIETYETPEGRANALYTLDEQLMSSLERGVSLWCLSSRGWGAGLVERACFHHCVHDV